MKKQLIYNKIRPFAYVVGKVGSWWFSKFRLRLKVVKNEIKKDGRKKVIICNHESFFDFMALIHSVKGPAHMVTSSAMIRTNPICKQIENFGVIAKNQFQTVPSDMRKMKAVLDDGKTLVLFPAGIMPEGGWSTPTPSATAKTLKWFGADVYVAKIRGTYLCKPKWSHVFRKGRSTIEIYKLATSEEFSALSLEDAVRLIDAHLYFDAYKNNLVDMVKYKHGDNVEGLENVVYKCPHCNEEYSIKCESSNVLTCSKCGYSVKSDCYGILHQNGEKPLIYSLVSDWHRFVEKSVYEKVKADKNYQLKTRAEVLKINDKKHKFESVGKAEITLDTENITMDGKVCGQDFHRVIFAQNFPALPSVPGKHFDVQDGVEIYRIRPENPEVIVEWMLSLKAIFKISHE
ncbi:MAG: 1-acyl-sn-glycerol-3-phosphate acyltransferase [Clostridia bacterium]|nr:1-acyl-sn-glycerol-3-phosphate acyltransferase [Clostridia bacterium]